MFIHFNPGKGLPVLDVFHGSNYSKYLKNGYKDNIDTVFIEDGVGGSFIECHCVPGTVLRAACGLLPVIAP